MSIVDSNGSEFVSAIVVESHGDVLVVDSRLVASDLDIDHPSLMKTIKAYKSVIEQRFGVIGFENGKPLKGSQGGRPEKFAWLNEDQAMFVMTLSRNSDRVVNCKGNLVAAFSDARKKLAAQPSPVMPQTYIEALEALLAAEKQKALMQAEQDLLKQENEALAEAVDELFDYSSIIRIAKFNGMDEKAFKWHKLKAATNILGLEIKQVPCPRFVTKNLYPHDAWRFCYPEVRLPETTTLVIGK